MENVQQVKVREIMTVRTAKIRHEASLHQAAELLALTRVSDLMVVDGEDNFFGVLSEGDILRSALPDVDEILAEGGSLETAFDIFVKKGKNLSELPITPLVIREPISVDPEDHVAKATTVLWKSGSTCSPSSRMGSWWAPSHAPTFAGRLLAPFSAAVPGKPSVEGKIASFPMSRIIE